MKTIELSVNSNFTRNLERFFALPAEVLFFDIETTGFSARTSSIYLIGCAFYTKNGWRIRQYFANTPAEETEIVRAFTSFASTFSHFVHFNGLTFDVPFIQAKCKKHAIPAFAPLSQTDLYKSISPYKNLLHLPGCRQKQLEEYVGIHREDPFNGGQLIELYRAYGENYDEQLLQVLLLHNSDDLAGMLQLYSIMAVPALFEQGEFHVEEILFADALDANGQPRTECRIRLSAGYPLPVPVTWHGAETAPVFKQCFFTARDQNVLIKLPVWETELKYFFPDYKNYAYLPDEDQAIHKSVAVYVDKSRRMPATAATCYIRKSGRFLPWFGGSDESVTLFRADFKEKQHFFLPDEAFLSDQARQLQYIQHFLEKVRK